MVGDYCGPRAKIIIIHRYFGMVFVLYEYNQLNYIIMKGTREDVAKTINEIADGFKEIANDILNDCYDPQKWQSLYGKMANVTTCLLVQNHTFQEDDTL